MSNTKNYKWHSAFDHKTTLHMIDGAELHYEKNQGITYTHGLLRDHFIIMKKEEKDFYALPFKEKVKFTLKSKNKGLIPYAEIIFWKGDKKINFYDIESENLIFEVPPYDRFDINIRAYGEGKTQLLSLDAEVIDK